MSLATFVTILLFSSVLPFVVRDGERRRFMTCLVSDDDDDDDDDDDEASILVGQTVADTVRLFRSTR